METAPNKHANPLKGLATFEAGGIDYTLTYDVNALILAEEASGMDIDKLLAALDRGNSLKVLRAMVWAGLQAQHDCHLIEAGEIIQAATAGVAGDAMRKAIAGAFPPPVEEPTKNPRKAASGTGGTGSSGGRQKA
jgi:hypothetical protein